MVCTRNSHGAYLAICCNWLPSLHLNSSCSWAADRVFQMFDSIASSNDDVQLAVAWRSRPQLSPSADGSLPSFASFRTMPTVECCPCRSGSLHDQMVPVGRRRLANAGRTTWTDLHRSKRNHAARHMQNRLRQYWDTQWHTTRWSFAMVLPCHTEIDSVQVFF